MPSELRPHRRRIAIASAILLTMGLFTACGGGPSSNAAAGTCAGPRLTVTPVSAKPGDEVAIKGRYFRNGCDDTGGSSSTPASGVPLTLTPGDGSKVELGKFDAKGELGTIDDAVLLPSSVQTGEAQLQLGDAPPVAITISAVDGP